MEKLNHDRRFRVCYMHFVENKTCEQIAEHFGLSSYIIHHFISELLVSKVMMERYLPDHIRISLGKRNFLGGFQGYYDFATDEMSIGDIPTYTDADSERSGKSPERRSFEERLSDEIEYYRQHPECLMGT